MAFPEFTPPSGPEVGAMTTTGARTRVAQFGDGYSSRSGDGLNGIKHLASLRWQLLTPAKADEIEAFFEARKGYEAFTYAVPGMTGALNWVCSQWGRSTDSFGFQTIAADFEEVFDL